MKYIGKEARFRLNRLYKYRLRKFLKLKKRRRNNKINLQGYVRIQAPTLFSTINEGRRNELLDFIQQIKYFVTYNKKILLNFHSTEKMFTSGTLLFFSEIRNLFNLVNNKAILTCIKSRNDKVNQVLKQIGFFKLIRFKNKFKLSYGDVVKWKFTCGSNVDGAKFENILGEYSHCLKDSLQEKLYKGFTEAMANTHHHAYEGVRPEGEVAQHKESWWAFSQLKDGKLHVVFCDLGIGIPVSLPKKHGKFFKRIIEKFRGEQNDADIIEEAVTSRRSRTELGYRGKGLAQLCDVIEHLDDSKLLIHSNKGAYIYENNASRKICFHHSVGGTIIEWMLNI